MINEFKYDQTWKTWPSPLTLSLYNPFKILNNENERLNGIVILQKSSRVHHNYFLS